MGSELDANRTVRTVDCQSKAHKSPSFPYPQSERISEAASQSTPSSNST
ncbi:unnamed protein product [Prunus brigantina]